MQRQQRRHCYHHLTIPIIKQMSCNRRKKCWAKKKIFFDNRYHHHCMNYRDWIVTITTAQPMTLRPKWSIGRIYPAIRPLNHPLEMRFKEESIWRLNRMVRIFLLILSSTIILYSNRNYTSFKLHLFSIARLSSLLSHFSLSKSFTLLSLSSV